MEQSWLFQHQMALCHKLESTFFLPIKLEFQQSLFILINVIWFKMKNFLISLKWKSANFLPNTTSQEMKYQLFVAHLSKHLKATQYTKRKLKNLWMLLINISQHQFGHSTSHSLCLLKMFSQSKAEAQL